MQQLQHTSMQGTKKPAKSASNQKVLYKEVREHMEQKSGLYGIYENSLQLPLPPHFWTKGRNMTSCRTGSAAHACCTCSDWHIRSLIVAPPGTQGSVVKVVQDLLVSVAKKNAWECPHGGVATTTGPDATHPPDIYQNLKGGWGHWQYGMGGSPRWGGGGGGKGVPAQLSRLTGTVRQHQGNQGMRPLVTHQYLSGQQANKIASKHPPLYLCRI